MLKDSFIRHLSALILNRLPNMIKMLAAKPYNQHLFIPSFQVFFFAAPPGMRLNLRGSFLDIRALSRVPLPPSQKPWPFLPTSPAWQIPQSSGR